MPVASSNKVELQATLRALAAGRRIPSATYRIQLTPDFGFREAEGIVDYLDDLGASDLYLSPILRARAGSTHGYDVIDPGRINPDLGGEAGFDALADAVRRRRMGILLDIVPNHMGIRDPNSTWWLDVLESGPSSEYASFFDIEWQPIKPELHNRILLPILEDQYGKVLEDGKLRLIFDAGAFHLRYEDDLLPIAPRTYAMILERVLDALAGPREASERDAVLELESILTALSYLPEPTETETDRRLERAREKEIVKRRLAALCASSPAVASALETALAAFNGAVGDPRSFDALDDLIESQIYRLAYWRVAGEEINYRRFFDINDLAAIRMELPRVFEATHDLVLRLLVEGKVSGLRIDHPDGLYRPDAYFRRLQHLFLLRLLHRTVETADWEAPVARWLLSQSAAHGREAPLWPLYVVVEKILSEAEPLPLDWAVSGTTGYEFLASTNALFVDPAGRQAFDRLYQRFTGHAIDFEELSIAAQALIMNESLASEINELSHELERIGERNRRYRDFTLNSLRDALSEVIACLPVYRTYIDADDEVVSDRDRDFIARAVRRAQRRLPRIDESVFRYIEDALLLRNLHTFDEEDGRALACWVMRFQQITGPVMAKGAEDTAFYIYNRLISLNEVGSHPTQFGITPEDFHRTNRTRAAHWPHALLATSTHDNKRSEDVRARINVLSEMPAAWHGALKAWSRLTAGKKTRLDDGETSPDRNDLYHLYQVLLGAWPFDSASRTPRAIAQAGPFMDPAATAPSPHDPAAAVADAWAPLLPPGRDPAYRDFRERITDYMCKAAKEAKVHGSWINPDEAYEKAIGDFIAGLLSPVPGNRFLDAFAPLARRVAYLGQFNSLSQVVLKLTSPGVPDIYQGNEIWDFSLVDPDNRRPVDFELRRGLLDALRAREARIGSGEGPSRAALADELLATGWDGRIKLYVTHRLLGYRRAHRAFFAEAEYRPLEAVGAAAAHICAYARLAAEDRIIVVVPRLVAGLMGELEGPPVGPRVWQDTRLLLPEDGPHATCRNLFTDEVVRPTGGASGSSAPAVHLAEAMARFPVAVLVPEA